MELDINKVIDKITQNDFIDNFIKELSITLEKYTNKNVSKVEGENMNEIELTTEEELEFDRKEFDFLQNYFKRELSDLDKGETYIVTDKFENDNQYHRYKVTQYKDNLECKYIAFEKDLPQNVQLRDIVRKIDGKYIYDGLATEYVKDSINKIKQDIINKR